MGCLQVGLPHARKPSGWFFVVRRIREEMTKILGKVRPLKPFQLGASVVLALTKLRWEKAGGGWDG